MYTITGNTYMVREVAKAAGFGWDGRRWTGGQAAADRWAQITNGTWSGAWANAVRKANANVVKIGAGDWSINDLMAPANSDY